MQEKSHSKKSYSKKILEDESISLLEWDSLKTHLASFASTEMGKRAILSFEIPSDYEVSQRLLNETVEITELENNLDKSISFFGVFDLFLLETLPNRIFGVMTNSTLIAVTLFIFMGVLLEKSKVAEELLLTISDFFSGFRGGLGL